MVTQVLPHNFCDVTLAMHCLVSAIEFVALRIESCKEINVGNLPHIVFANSWVLQDFLPKNFELPLAVQGKIRRAFGSPGPVIEND